MKTTLRTLLVGVGGRAAWVRRLAVPENGFQIVALCDVDERILEEARGDVGLPPEACFTDLAAALENGGLDCMILCAPTRFHVPYAIQGVEAGLPVLTEKGMAPDWESACRLMEHLEKCGGIVCVAQNYRYRPVDRAVADCLHGRVPEAPVGPVVCADLIQHRVRPHPRTLNYPFASVWDMSCHHFDTLLGLFGRPVAMTGHAFRAAWSPYEHPNNTSAHIEFASGTRVNYFHGHDSARTLYHFCAHGEFGALVVRPGGTAEHPDSGGVIEYSERPAEQFGTRPVRGIPPAGSGPSELGVLSDFHDYVVRGIEPGISARHNIEVMAMCRMFVLSVQENRRVLREELDTARSGRTAGGAGSAASSSGEA